MTYAVCAKCGTDLSVRQECPICAKARKQVAKWIVAGKSAAYLAYASHGSEQYRTALIAEVIAYEVANLGGF